ncbi:unnamed protein product [Paramecium octaurelia]|uniref:Tetratricopeptide repeat protein n=1 Tax=Paramecium octaurelia TaxID=43137 RepID=A0A8S1Y876_PAROT|nr:unnamed protein product [Paramecium octaurelia]
MGYNHDLVYYLKGNFGLLINFKGFTLVIDYSISIANHLNKFSFLLISPINQPNIQKCLQESRQPIITYYHFIGVSLIPLGKFIEALQKIKMAIDLNPKNENGYYNKGYYSKYWKALLYQYFEFSLTLYELEKYQEAQNAYEDAIKLNNRQDITYQGKGNKYMQIFNRQRLFKVSKLKLIQTKIMMELMGKRFKILSFFISLQFLQNKLTQLHLLQKFKDALIVYDQAIYMNKNPIRLKLKVTHQNSQC